MIGFIGFIYSAIFIPIPLMSSNSAIKNYLVTNINDDFAVANILTPTAWLGWEWILGLLFLALLILSFIYQLKSDKAVKLLLIGNALFLFIFSVPKIMLHHNHVLAS